MILLKSLKTLLNILLYRVDRTIILFRSKNSFLFMFFLFILFMMSTRKVSYLVVNIGVIIRYQECRPISKLFYEILRILQTKFLKDVFLTQHCYYHIYTIHNNFELFLCSYPKRKRTSGTNAVNWKTHSNRNTAATSGVVLEDRLLPSPTAVQRLITVR